MTNVLKRFVFCSFLLIGTGLQLSAQAQAIAGMPSRIEVYAIQSKTLTGEEFLRGDSPGKPVTLAGELRIPVGKSAKYPAVVLVHGSGGINAGIDVWEHALNQAGIATFVVDSFTGRGIVSTVADQTQLHNLAMMVDAYRALDVLAKHPRIDSNKIAVMGFSKGATAAIFSASKRFRKMYGGDAKFAAHIGLYTPCNYRFIGDTEVTGAPMRLFHGTPDDYVSVAPCRQYVQSLKQQGVDVVLTEFPDTWHAYDNPLLPKKLDLPKAQSTRNCHTAEEGVGHIVNADTHQPFTTADSCVAVGAHVGYNPDSAAQTTKMVIEFLTKL